MRSLRTIKLTASNVVVDGVVHRKGDVLTVIDSEAEELVKRGRATYTVRVRALHDNAVILDHVCRIGDVVETHEGHAISLHNSGAAEVIDRDSISRPDLLREPPAPKPKYVPEPPYHGLPLASVRITAKNGLLVGNRIYPPGSKAVSIPQVVADRAVESGAAEFTLGSAVPAAIRAFSKVKDRETPVIPDPEPRAFAPAPEASLYGRALGRDAGGI
jgi:hypothetical protein